jgi:hypothetical protein
MGLATIFYSLKFETSLFVASYDSQGHGEGIRPHLHTGDSTLNSQSQSQSQNYFTTDDLPPISSSWLRTP